MVEWPILVTAFLGPAGGIAAALLTSRHQRRLLDQEIKIQRERIRAEFGTEHSVEEAIRQFLSLTKVRYRTFPMIRHHIGGFEPNQLRQLLVRSGAVRFMAADGTELWALRERVAEEFQLSSWKHKDPPVNKVPETELFPAAFKDPAQY